MKAYNPIILCFFLCFSFCCVTYADINNNTETTTDDTKTLSSLSYFVDKSQGELTLPEIRALDRQAWITEGDESTINLGYNNKTIWLRGTLTNTTAQPTDRIIVIDQPRLDHVTFYVPNGNGYTAEMSGDLRPFTTRAFQDRLPGFSTTLPPHSTRHFYVSIKSHDELTLPIKEWHPAAYKAHNTKKLIIVGAFYGALALIIIVNFLNFTMLRDTRFISYMVSIACYMVFHMGQNGYLSAYVLPNNPFIAEWLRPFSLFLMMFNTAYISMKYLNTEKHLNRLHPVLFWFSVMGLVLCVVMSSVSNEQIAITTTIYSTIFMLMLLAAGILSLKKNRQAALSYLAIWSSMAVASILYVLQLLAILPKIAFTEYSLDAFVLILGTGLCFKLTHKIFRSNRQKMRKERAALKKEVLARKEREKSAQLLEKYEETVRLHEVETAASRAESRAKSEFLATMSHEIRTPMNGVLGLTELLMDTQLSSRQHNYLKTIHSSGESLMAILNDILDYSQIEAGQIKLESKDVNIETVADDLISVFASSAQEKKLSFNIVLHRDLPRIFKTDANRLRQILMQLINNAIKFTDHGEIVLRIYLGKDSMIRFEVSDTGKGIPEDQQDKLFHLFSRVDNSMTRATGGAGLGLAICRGSVESMGGEIGLRSVAGRGSTFFFTLPHITSSQAQPEPLDLDKRNILVIDNSLPFIESCAELFAYWNASLEIILNPDSVRLSSIKKADIIICHQNMAICLPQEVEVDEKTIFMAGYSKRGGHHARTVLQKPVRQEQLRNRIQDKLHIQTPDAADDQSQLSTYSNLKVLVAEDNMVNRMVIKGILNKLGVTPDFAANGLLAVRAVLGAEQPFDLILMDCEMPELDGYEACREIRQLPGGGPDTLTIVGLSAHALLERETMAYEAGMGQYLTKPVHIEDIRKVLNEVASRTSSGHGDQHTPKIA